VVRSYFANGFEENGTDDYFYTRDHLGTIREVVASDGTTVGSRLSYDPWGKLTEAGSVLSDFTYTGHYYDRETGLNLAWYRGYDANLGRWLSTDPIGLQGGLNLYEYVTGDPVNFADPTGRQAIIPIPWGPVIGIGAAAGGLACYFSPECRAYFTKKWEDICEPDAPPVPDEDEKRCIDEWAAAHRKCAGLIVDPSDENERLRGGHMNLEECAKGFVTESCGGNLIDYGKPRKRKIYR
jgi:RHS repeat-associated protein